MKKIYNYLIKLAAFIIKIVSLPIYLISFLIPKNNKIWIFGSWSGKSFSDNSKAFFLYIEKNIKHINPVWLTKNKSVLNELRCESKNAYYFYSLKGIYYSLVAKVAIMSTSWIDLPLITFIFPWRIKLIQLWHGTPLKRMDLKAGTLKEKILRRLFISYLGREYDLVISANQNNVKIYTEIFNLETNKIKVTGQPRNDLIFLNKKFYHNRKGIKKICLYMPTWRNYEFDIFGNGFNPKSFNRFLRDNEILFVIKIHPNEVEMYKDELNYSNIVFWEDRDIYPFLSNFDILLTDYSSIYFDFLILNRSIIFTPFDFQEYSKLNGFYYDYDSVTPGPKAKDWDDVINHIQDILHGIDKYKEKRSMINRNFNKYQDGENSERVFQEIMKVIS